jgi:4'-phosphopantetheinyl transferase
MDVEADVPARDEWLSAGEADCQQAMRLAKRRADWRLGRWTAKRALAAYRRLPGDAGTLSQIEIRPAPSGAPEAFLSNQPAAVSVSLSHSSGVAICAVAEAGVALGCDLEVIEPRSPAFIADYFTSEEQELIARAQADQAQLVTLLWSAKESVLKALGEGLRLDTRVVIVRPVEAVARREKRLAPASPRPLPDCAKASALAVAPPDTFHTWSPLQARCTDGRVFHGWWRHTGNLLRTVVTSPPSSPPLAL